ncbi:nucleotidyltransferase family protein [Cryobacterium frigoriphilum]|uniref:Nucleotidyltransferase family protein n=1 Tax=Cryobacterium frigoriphilum TaxID=1259150 RepID=A0A4R9A7U1_9MICO|nr:nucleotidyltransferase family protein [Cryobacterium frigoriphilum]TFD53929.1 nucleotidyltransferase family protein [Cryobacterium frigoriphilum]
MAASTTTFRGQTRSAGLVLAAGGGTRYGTPKVLVRGADGVPWLQHAVTTLAASGCSPILVVLGAAAEQAETLLAETLLAETLGGSEVPVVIVRAPDWAAGLSASLRAGLDAAGRLEPLPSAIAVVPVDVPDLNTATVARVLGTHEHEHIVVTPDSLRQAVFGSRPGHPVLIGRAHWAPLAAGLQGDQGARPYLMAHHVQAVECGDLSTGLDVDSPAPGPLPAPGHG